MLLEDLRQFVSRHGSYKFKKIAQKATAQLDHVRKRSFSNRYAVDIQKEICATNDFEPRMILFRKKVLSSKNRKLAIAFVEALKHWTVQDLRKVIFSDDWKLNRVNTIEWSSIASNCGLVFI